MFHRLFAKGAKEAKDHHSSTSKAQLDARQAALFDAIKEIGRDPYLCLADPVQRLITVFDDLRYDRADLDLISAPMRSRAIKRLTPLGFRQVSGLVLENKEANTRIHLPRFRALGASPFDATRDVSRRPQDYFLLTPTQAAAQIIDQYDADQAVAMIKALAIKHPVNLLRLSDFLGRDARHQAFKRPIGHLRFVQREAVAAEPLRSRFALR